MKIVFLLQDTGSVYGAERATLDLACGLIAKGVAVHVLLIVETRLDLSRSKLQEAFAAVGIPFSTVTTAGRFSRRLVSEIRAALVAQQAAVLHSVGYKADVHGCLAVRGTKIPQVSTVHGWLNRPDLKEQFYAWLNIRAFKRCARVIALSRFYEKLLVSMGVPRVEYLPTGFAIPVAAGPASPAGNPITFGILGRLSWEKNHAMFLEAAAKLRERGVDARFLIGGDGPLEENLNSQISNLELPVEMTGYIAAEKFFERISALVICSRIENQPLVVMEAMARAIPVIATNVGGLPDLVEDGATGRLIPSGDAEALADAMADFAGEPPRAAAMGAAGREKLRRDFDRDRWIARQIALYGSISRGA